MSIVTAVVDAHVHLHACYRPDELLSKARQNLAGARPSSDLPTLRVFYLLLAECQNDDSFGDLRSLALNRSPPSGLNLQKWIVRPTEESRCVVVADGSAHIYVVAGRQVACREGLEVLVLGTTQRFKDGRPIRDLLEETEALGVPRVIPWGPGKWFFRRGRLLNSLLEEFRKPTLFLGDEGGRPGFWSYPAHFARGARLGVRDLPGTDPLPFSHDVGKVGRMGFCVPVDLDPQRPADSLMRSLVNPNVPFERFATLEPPLRFVRNQIGMQLLKRRREAHRASV